MKATGIVRRVDDLGRIVMPKELRQTLGIQPGDPIEFFVKGDQVVIAKYIPTHEVTISLREDQIDYLNGLLPYGVDVDEVLRAKLKTARARFDS